MNDPAVVILLIAVVVLATALFVVSLRSVKYRAIYTSTSQDVKDARKHSVATSKASTLGQAAEHLAPYFPDMAEQFVPSDWHFLGKPIDFVVFDGLHKEAVDRIVLVEVKTGKESLSTRQRQIKAAVDAGALSVEWRTVSLPKPRSPSNDRKRGPRIIALPPDLES